jgi:hypothetical protein
MPEQLPLQMQTLYGDPCILAILEELSDEYGDAPENFGIS